ncbi:MAG: prephenate dehydrogenase [Epsilonproteobacteria bacterium]|nr:prephenate dehydrogenase [Campylobacterota bacterium]
MRVGVIGLGLMGGSFALALKKEYRNRKIEIIGMDHNEKHCLKALELNIADKITDEIKDLYEVDLIVLAIPVEPMIKIIKELEGVSKNTTIIDFGSTKEKIVKSIPNKIRGNFVASHPMTGTEKAGPLAADKNLYRGKVVVICDSEQNTPYHLNKAKSIYKDLGMKIIYMDAKEHDRHAAFISHMPHAVSFALANSVMAQEDPKAIIALAGGGFKDMSRIAKSSPNMWIDIFKQNKENLLEAIEAFDKELQNYKESIKNEKWDEVRDLILKANRLHDIL